MSQIGRIVIILGVLTLIGTFGFSLVEGWKLFDSLYMTIISLTTVGYGEVHPLSPAGRLFAMVYLVVGLGVFLYGAAQLGEVVVRAQLHQWLGKRKMDTTIKALKGHYIVCGFGRMGRSLCQQLASRKLPFVAVDKSDQALALCQESGWPWL